MRAHQAGSSARQLGALRQGGVCARSELARQLGPLSQSGGRARAGVP